MVRDIKPQRKPSPSRLLLVALAYVFFGCLIAYPVVRIADVAGVLTHRDLLIAADLVGVFSVLLLLVTKAYAKALRSCAVVLALNGLLVFVFHY